jgi:predicted permease
MRNAPATGWTWNGPFYIDDGAARQRNFTNYNFVGAEYFQVMGIPLVAGRAIDVRDLGSSRRVAVVNEAAAKAFGPGSPVGKRFAPPDKGPDYEVIGVARNAIYSRLRETNPPTIYIPYNQPFGGNWMGIMTYAVRAKASPRSLFPTLGAALRQTDPMLPAVEMKTLEGQLDQHLAQERILAFVASMFGAVTLALACMGVYGMTAYSVAARTREIGIRVALGASGAGVMRMVIRRAFLAVAVGLAIGGPPTYIIQHFLKSQLFGVDPADAAGVALCSVAIAAAAVMAAWLPARRALKIDPIRALRWE